MNLEDDPNLERELANILVGAVCRCKPRVHERGYPECDLARRAARLAIKYIEDNYERYFVYTGDE